MTLNPIRADLSLFPERLQPLLSGAKLYDSSCSREASVLFVDKDRGYFLKSAPAGTLGREAEMTRYFHEKGLSANVPEYFTEDRDWLLTEKIPGDDCTAPKYLDEPLRLCDLVGESLARLHAADGTGCPVANHTERYLAAAEHNYQTGRYDHNLFPDNWGYASAEEAYQVVKSKGNLLQSDTLLHGDYCLPNIILDDWSFSGFIDLGGGGFGDRHVDLFWAIWSLSYNLKTDQYRQRFIDAYGRDRVDEEKLRLIAAIEVFG